MSEAYFANPALSRSDLRMIATNPAKWWKQRQGLLPRDPPSKEMIFGSALDKLLCDGKGPDPLPENWVLITDEVLAKNGSRAGNAYREWVSQFAGANVVLLTQRDVDRLQADSVEQRKALECCVESVLGHKKAREYMFHQHAIRQRAMWTDETKSLPDLIVPSHVVVDLKTSNDVEESHHLRSIRKYWYDLQAFMAQYHWCIECDEVLPVVHVVVRNCEPYDCAVYELGESIIDAGRKRYFQTLAQYYEMKESGIYQRQGHGQVITLEAPRYWQYESEYQLEPESEV